MKSKLKKIIALAVLLSGGSVGAQELFSVNLWSPGRNFADEWQQESWRDTVRVNGKEAGVWPTTVWDDLNVGGIGVGSSATINGSDSSTATFTIIEKRNQSPYNWTTLRDGSTDPDDDPAYMADGNASLLDAKLIGTEFDGASGPVDPSFNSIIEVSGLEMPVYDVVIYLSMNSGQFGGGGNAGLGYIDFNDTGLTSWRVPAGQPPTTLTEIEEDGGTGNYIRYNNVTGPSFTAHVYGHGFNHGGIAGFQILEVETDVGDMDPDVSTVTASPAFVPADDATEATVTVTLRDSNQIPLAGREVTLEGDGDAAINPADPVETDANGQAIFTVRSATPGTEAFTATDVTDDSDVVITQTASVNFVGPVNAAESATSASPSMIVADGVVESAITVTAKDANGFPVAGRTATLAAVSGPGTPAIEPAEMLTDADGEAVFTVSSDTIGIESFQATVDGVEIDEPATVEFVDPGTPFSFNVNFVRFTAGFGPFPEESELTGPAGGLGERWNQFAANSSSGTIMDRNGVLTGASFTTDFTEGRPGGEDSMPIFEGSLTDFGRGTSRTLTVSGLEPGSLHDVWLAAFRNSNPGVRERPYGRWESANPTSSPVIQFMDGRESIGSEFIEGENYIVFRTVQTDSNGEIVINGTGMTEADGADDDYRLALSGFQIIPVGEALITSFGIPGSAGVIDQENNTISLTVPFDTDLATLAPEFTLSSGEANHTSGEPPSPTFAVQNPATYTVTDDTTDPVTVNEYTVIVIVEDPPTPTETLVIDLGAGTQINGDSFIGEGPANLPIPALPAGSILRGIEADLVLEGSTQFNFASDIAVLFDPTPETPGEGFSLIISGEEAIIDFGAAHKLNWPEEADDEVIGTPLVDTKTEEDWIPLVGDIDLATHAIFLGNAFGSETESGTWSGTITLTYDVADDTGPGDTDYDTWASGAPFDGDASGDNIANGMAFLLGAVSPADNALGLLPAPETTVEGLVLTFSMRNAANRGDAALAVEWSNDLGMEDAWEINTAAVPESSGTVNGVEFVITPNGILNNVVATIPFAAAGDGRLFARLAGSED